MAREYCLIYRYTGQNLTSGDRSVDLNKFVIHGGNINKINEIGKVTRIEYEFWHLFTSKKETGYGITWRSRAMLKFDGNNYIYSAFNEESADIPQSNVNSKLLKNRYIFTFDTDQMSRDLFKKLTTIKVVDSNGDTSTNNNMYSVSWCATEENPMYIYVYFTEIDAVIRYATDNGWEICEVYYAIDGKWQRVMPYYAIETGNVWMQT